VNLLRRLRYHKVYHYFKLTLGVWAAILAVAVVTGVMVDLGPSVRNLAETQGSKALKRPIHIGRLAIRLFLGRFVLEDFSIEGLEPTDRPFFTAKHLELSLDWSTLLRREVTITAVDMTDWQMLVEKWDNRQNFPKFTSDEPGGPRRFTTTLKHLRAWRGQFAFQDHEAPWSVVAPNIDITMGNLPQYHGTATFTGGTVAIQRYVPFSANMKAEFVLDGGHVHLDRIDLETDGAKTVATGDVELGRLWPEQQYSFKSRVQFARMRRIFFKDEKWELSGDGDVAGVFHLFKNGRDLTATFSSPALGVNSYRFPDLYGKVHWTPTVLDVTQAGAKFFGADATFTYSLQPLGSKTPTVARFETSFENADLRSFTEFQQLQGLRFAGAASAEHVVLEWPLGRFGERRGSGRLLVAAPAGVRPMAASLAAARSADARHARHEWGPFAPEPLPRSLPIAGDLSFRFDPKQVHIDSGRFVTERTHVTFQGSTAWGGDSRLMFHVTSSDWQESDQVLAGIMTDFGKPTGPVAFGGRGEFDGLMTGPFRDPRVEGEFSGEDLRAFDTMWGAGEAHIVVENNYVRVTDGTVRLNDSEMRFDGLYSLGYPRRDGGDEIDARIRVVRRDIDSLRHAFRIDDYPVSGRLSGEFRLTGAYQHPIGFGGMTLESFVAYGEPFPSATASLRFDGVGVRIDGVTVPKGGGTITGAAFVGWDGTYSFNFDGRRIPVEQISRLNFQRAPLTGIAEFTAAGSATFDSPRNDYRFRVNDLFIGDEGIGQVTATLALRGTELSGEIDAASPRLAITATGRVAMTPRADSDITIRFHDMSLDPYVRPFVPRLSPFTTAVASGSLRVSGRLADVDRLAVAGQVDTLDLRLFDYALKNGAPIRMSLDDRVIRVDDLQLEGEDTRLRVSGSVGLGDERVALRAVGDANLGILQGFFRDVRGSGRAELTAAIDGPLKEPVFSGQATVIGGRIRHYSLPNSLDAINGVLRFDANGLRLDELNATMGGGRIQFGGRVAFDGYEPGELNVTVRGSDVQLRYPVGVRSVIDADLSLRGNYRAPTLGGTVTVKSAVYGRRIDEPDLFDFIARRARETAAASTEATVATAAPLKFDIEIEVPSSFRVENNIARMTANANFTLRGTYDRPSWFGHADILERGELLLLGRRYRVTKGTIDLVNPARFEPLFDIEAETNVRVPGQTYRVVVGFVGTPDRPPVLSLSSEPPLSSSADVLALLLSDVRRQDAPELRALQNPQQNATDILTTRATQLLAGPISSEVGKVIEQTFGVDTFQLTPSFINTDPTTSQPTSRLNPTARLTIGKRISDRAYLTFSRSLASPINDQLLQLEYDATERWSWIVSRNEDSQTYALEFRVRHVF
jgi:translocation-and-assembly-module (TAM) inner membrane subunit TamB-like protein